MEEGYHLDVAALPSDPMVAYAIFFVAIACSKLRSQPPPGIDEIGVLLWAEGVETDKPMARLRTENLGAGLQMMSATRPLSEVAGVLTSPDWDQSLPGGKRRFTLGLVERPSVLNTHLGPRGIERGETVGVREFVCGSKGRWLRAMGIEDEQVETVLGPAVDRLRELTGLDIRGGHAARLGNAIIVGANEAASVPLTWAPVKPSDGSGPTGIEIGFNAARLAGRKLTLRVALVGTDRAIVRDCITEVDSSNLAAVLRIEANQPIGGAKVDLWVDGEHLYGNDCPLLLSIHNSLHMTTRSVRVLDRLTEKLERMAAASADRAVAAAIAKVGTSQHAVRASETLVGEKAQAPWRTSILNANTELEGLLPPRPSGSEYFEQGPVGRANAVHWIAEAIAAASEAWLIDPYFDQEGARALLPRIRRDSSLMILTSLPDFDGAYVAGLKGALEAVAHAMTAKVQIWRAVRGGGREAAIHDRYLVLRGNDGPLKGYMLSNSLSGLAVHFPLLVCVMTRGQVARVIGDLNVLLDGGEAGVAAGRLWPPPLQAAVVPVSDDGGSSARQQLVRSLALGVRDVAAANALRRAAGVDANPTSSEAHDRLRTSLVRKIVRRLVGKPGQAQGRRRGALAAALGELAARGARELALAVLEGLTKAALSSRRRAVAAIAHHLRLPATKPPQPKTRRQRDFERSLNALIHAVAGVEGEHAAIGFGMKCAVGTEAAIELALGGRYGRVFEFEVLLALAPRVAVNVAEQICDPNILVALLDPYHQRADAVASATADALLASGSVFLRGVGAQLRVAGDATGNFEPWPILRVADLPSALGLLGREDISPEDRASMGSAWIAHAADPIVAALADAFVAVLARASSARARIALVSVLGRTTVAASVLEAVHRLASTRRVDLLRGALEAFAARIAKYAGEGSFQVTEDDASAAEVFGRALARYAASSSRTIEQASAEFLAREVIAREAGTLTPLRGYPNRLSARLAYGWLLLWEGAATVSAGTVSTPGSALSPGIAAWLAESVAIFEAPLRDALSRLWRSASARA